MTCASLEKRSLTIQGHRTSVALEPAFWAVLDAEAARQGMATSALVAAIDEVRAIPLARALRLFALEAALRAGGGGAR